MSYGKGPHTYIQIHIHSKLFCSHDINTHFHLKFTTTLYFDRQKLLRENMNIHARIYLHNIHRHII